jgi:hypothetical protein
MTGGQVIEMVNFRVFTVYGTNIDIFTSRCLQRAVPLSPVSGS